LEVFSGFHGSFFNGTFRSRETLLYEQVHIKLNGEQASKKFGGEHLRIRSHKSNTKRAGQKIFLCPITGKDFRWFRNWSVKRRIPEAPTFDFDFSSPDFFPRPFSLFPAPLTAPGSLRMRERSHMLAC